MSAPLDFDEIIRREAMTSAERAQAICDELELEFNYALRHDVELLIELARAASEAHEQAERHHEEERAALDPATDPEDAARMRRAIERRRKVRIKALAILEASADD
ncbi:hypothetical protein [Microbacterium phyllosphaerae]|uniref:hypothetical protein n=1 Tax=Microbacterium phyllosphaerae TaxID=124798 RepID=UPI003D64C235